MNWVDYLIIFIVAASTLFGAWRGFVKEALSLVTWLAAIWFAWRFTFVVEPMLGDWVSAPELKIWAARAIVFVVIMVVGGLIAWLMRELVRHTGLSGTDRLLGSFFGLLRGALIFGLIVIAVQLSALDQDPWLLGGGSKRSCVPTASASPKAFVIMRSSVATISSSRTSFNSNST